MHAPVAAALAAAVIWQAVLLLPHTPLWPPEAVRVAAAGSRTFSLLVANVPRETAAAAREEVTAFSAAGANAGLAARLWRPWARRRRLDDALVPDDAGHTHGPGVLRG